MLGQKESVSGDRRVKFGIFPLDFLTTFESGVEWKNASSIHLTN
jgi:hypothetical protein